MKYLGVDFGLRRVGLAVSEGKLARAWKIVEGRGIKDLSIKIIDIVRKENFEKLVVGMPGGVMGKNIIEFIGLLKKRGIDIEATDETLSSRQALSEMIAAGVGRKKRRISDDVAAAIILQNHLDDLG